MDTVKKIAIILGLIISINQLLEIIIKIANRVNVVRNMYNLSQMDIYNSLNKYKNSNNSKFKKSIIMIKIFFSIAATEKELDNLYKAANPILGERMYKFTNSAKQRFKDLDIIFGKKNDKWK